MIQIIRTQAKPTPTQAYALHLLSTTITHPQVTSVALIQQFIRHNRHQQ